MFLITKDKPKIHICRACRALHRPKDCPRGDNDVLKVFERRPATITWETLMEATGLQYWQVKASVRRLRESGALQPPKRAELERVS